MTVGQWFIQLHNHLHWWGPGVLALYTVIVPWVLHYPLRYYEVVNYNPGSDMPKYETFSIYTEIFMVALPAYYVLWFALPHEGTEILLLILAAPFVGIYLLFFFVTWILEYLDNTLESGPDYEARKKSGMSYAEWEIFKYRVRKREEEKSLRAFMEREAMFRGEDIRKDRFRVIGGGKGDAK